MLIFRFFLNCFLVTKYSTSNSSASSSSSSSSSTILSLIIHYLSYLRVCHLSVYSSIRIQVRTTALFIRESEQGLQRIRGHFHTLPQLVNSSTPLDVDSILSSLNQQVDNFNARGSGYVIERLLQFVLVVTEYRPLCGSSYIPTPKRLQNKRCIVNVQNSDQKCFIYSILSCLHEAPTHRNRVRNYTPYLNTLNVDGLTFPVQTRDIPHFERANPKISVNVLAIDNDDTQKRTYSYSIDYASPHRNCSHHVNLLLLEDENDSSKNTIPGYTTCQHSWRTGPIAMHGRMSVTFAYTASQRNRHTTDTYPTALYTPPNTSSTRRPTIKI